MTEEEIAQLQETNKTLTQRVNQLESINTDLVGQKKELKKKLEDGFNDEDMKRELDNYKSQLEQVEKDKVELQNGYTKQISSLHMKQMLKDMGVSVHNSDALEAVAELALSEATYKDGGFVFLNKDGTTRFNDANKDYSLNDKINDLKQSDKSYLFKQAIGGGADDSKKTPPQNKNNIDAIRASYTF